MPEGPEVKVMSDYLREVLDQKILKSAKIIDGRYHPKDAHDTKRKPPKNWDKFNQALPLKVEYVKCKGKMIYLKIGGFYMINRLGMSGRWNQSDIIQFYIDMGKNPHRQVEFEFEEDPKNSKKSGKNSKSKTAAAPHIAVEDTVSSKPPELDKVSKFKEFLTTDKKPFEADLIKQEKTTPNAPIAVMKRIIREAEQELTQSGSKIELNPEKVMDAVLKATEKELNHSQENVKKEVTTTTALQNLSISEQNVRRSGRKRKNVAYREEPDKKQKTEKKSKAKTVKVKQENKTETEDQDLEFKTKTGKKQVKKKEKDPDFKADWAIFEHHPNKVWYCDPRRFGSFEILTSEDELTKALNKLGPDLLNPETKVEDFMKIIRLPKHQNKTLPYFLMKQDNISGVGNYLKCEALYCTKISPYRLIEKCSDQELQDVFHHLVRIMKISYGLNGNTIKTYYSPTGEIGSFYELLQCYGKLTDPEGRKIKTETTADGRTTHWVPGYQK